MEILTLPLFLSGSLALPSTDSVAACSRAHPLSDSIARHRTIPPSRHLCISSCCFNVLIGSWSCVGASASFTSTWPCALAGGVTEELSSWCRWGGFLYRLCFGGLPRSASSSAHYHHCMLRESFQSQCPGIILIQPGTQGRCESLFPFYRQVCMTIHRLGF